MFRVIIWIVLVCAVSISYKWWVAVEQPRLSTDLAIRQTNGGNDDAAALRAFEQNKGIAGQVAIWAIVAITLAMIPWRRLLIRKTVIVRTGAIAIIGFTVFGCRKPYDKPEYDEVKNNETAYVIPLEGDTKDQAKFASIEFLESKKVAGKRIQITHRWNQTDRWETDGEWIAAVKVIKVDRSPVTREWTAESTTGTAQKNQAIWIESSDSVGFSMGFSCTAMIEEADTSQFLYLYPSTSLATIMDSEIRARIQQIAAEVAAKYPLDALRGKKQEIIDGVRADVIPFFKKRGITVTTLGMFGGMTYENPEIQKAIDGTVIAQQLKVVAAAKWEAQQKENERILLEADALAEKTRRTAKGEAEAKLTLAQGEAEAVRTLSKAAGEAQQNPLLLQLKALEVQKVQIERWNGQFPAYYMAGSAPNLLLSVPTPAPATSPTK